MSTRSLNFIKAALSGAGIGILLTVASNAQARLEGTSQENMPRLWQGALVGGLAGLAYRVTGPIRRKSLWGYYASWMIALTIGMAVFFVPDLIEMPSLPTVGFWLFLGCGSGAGMAAFTRWLEVATKSQNIRNQ
jgi:hypothetical protein